jgi:hypothetical protein
VTMAGRAASGAYNRPPMPRARTSSILLAVLLLVSGAAFLRAEQLKLEHSPIARPRVPKFVSRVCTLGSHGCARGRHGVPVGFLLRDPGTVGLAIVDAGGGLVEQLMPPRPLKAGMVRVVWDFRTSAGSLARQGTYHLRIDLRSLGKTITLPDPLIIDDTPPVITVTSAPGVVPVRYRTSEPARVYAAATPSGASGIAHAVVIRGRGGRVRLRARAALPAGQVVALRLVAVDRAGNRSRVTIVNGLRVAA